MALWKYGFLGAGRGIKCAGSKKLQERVLARSAHTGHLSARYWQAEDSNPGFWGISPGHYPLGQLEYRNQDIIPDFAGCPGPENADCAGRGPHCSYQGGGLLITATAPPTSNIGAVAQPPSDSPEYESPRRSPLFRWPWGR